MNAPALVFLHAASHTKAMWLPQTCALRDEFAVLALDLPAHGTLSQMPFSFPASVDIVCRALDEMSIERAILVGASLGGFVAMQFAAQCPERVAGMVLAGCTFDPCRPAAIAVLTGESIVFPRGAKLFARRFHQWLRTQFPGPISDEIIAGGAYWDGAAQGVRALRGLDILARLSVYPGPVLLVNGADDWVHRSSEEVFMRVAQDSLRVVIDGAGHVPSLDTPDLFTQTVRTFAHQISLSKENT